MEKFYAILCMKTTMSYLSFFLRTPTRDFRPLVYFLQKTNSRFDKVDL
jgi:hypothetical protein